MKGKTRLVALVVLLVGVLTFAPGLAIADGSVWEEDFEEFEENDQPPEWDSGAETWHVVDFSSNGTRSLLIEGSDEEAEEPDQGILTWEDGPTVSLSDEFTIHTIARPEFPENDGFVRVGIGHPNPEMHSEEGANAFVHFDRREGETYFASFSATEAPEGADTIEDDFDSTWVNVILHSEDDNDTVTAKIWDVTEPEPTEPQLSTEVPGVSGQFSTHVGHQIYREAYVDEVKITGEEVIFDDPQLELDITAYLKPGQVASYTVYHFPEWTENSTGPRVDVTDDAVVSSEDPSIITVHDNNTVQASEENFGRINITAEYDGLETSENVTASPLEIEHLDILPAAWWPTAILKDNTVLWAMFSVLTAVVVARVTQNPWAALGTAQTVFVMGWLMGLVGTGLMITSLFYSILAGITIADVYRPGLK